MKRKSGDRPDTDYGEFDFDGRVGSVLRNFPQQRLNVATKIPPIELLSFVQVGIARTSRAAITLVLGGARSGKSRYVQMLAAKVSPVAFIATARPSDQEMSLRIERHRAARPTDWRTIEEPVHLDRVLADEGSNYRILVIDCLTLYAANLLQAEHGNLVTVEERLRRFYTALRSVHCSVALVSNEVGSGVVPAYLEGRRYRDLLGEINQQVARVADNVLLMVAGLPLVLKGTAEVQL